MIDLYQQRHITFRWVKGHSGDRWNDRADELAVEARESQKGSDGGGASAPRQPRPREVEGHVVVVMGHRPTELGGYGENLLAAAVRQRLADVIAAKAAMHDDLVVVSGLNLGAETLGVEAAAEAGVPYEAILPFPDPDSRWPDGSRAHFQRLVAGARRVKTLERKVPDSNHKLAGSFRRRESWLRSTADEAIVVWDGKDGALGKSVRSLQKDLGEENVWIIDPGEL